MVFQIALCDDINSFCVKLKKLLQTCFQSDTTLMIDIFHDGKSLINSLKDTSYQLIFLDIDLKNEISGIDVAKAIRCKDPFTEIAFVSAHTELAMQLFQVQPIDFLVKPITLERLKETIHTYYARHPENRVFSYRNKKYYITYNDIIYFECTQKKGTYHTKDTTQEFRLHESFQNFCDGISDFGFIQIHQSFCINRNYIHHITKDTVVLKNNMEFPLSRTYKDAFYQQYLRSALHD